MAAANEDASLLGSLLVGIGVIERWQLNEGVSCALAKGIMLGEALAELGHVTESDLDIILDLQAAKRANTREENSRRTIGLIAKATEKAATVSAAAQNALQRADVQVRRQRARRVTQ